MAFRLSLRSITRSMTNCSTTVTPRRGHYRHGCWISLLAITGLAGCLGEGDKLRYIGGNPDNVQFYRDSATRIDYPDFVQQSPETVTTTEEPRRVSDIRKEEIRDLSLGEATRTALQNAEIIRDNAQFLNPSNRLYTNPDFTSSIYDIAIQDSNTLYGQGGPEAALSEFDAQLSTSLMMGRTEQVSDSRTIGYSALATQSTDFGDYRSSLSKIFGSGASLTLSHNWYWTNVNQDPTAGGRPFASEFSSRPTATQEIGFPTVGAEFRAPLVAGAGNEFTRIAGPISRRPTLQSTPNVNQGVLIARIRTDIATADFEEAVANLLKDVEDTYWDLYLAYRTYDAEKVSQQSSLHTWREVKANHEAGKVGAADEAQARDNYFEVKTRATNALNSLFQTELRLRRLMGLPVNDGQVLRPADDPITAQFVPDWNMTLTEALVNRPELRRQKWNLKSLELQYTAAKSLVRPRLDFVSRYEVNGFGNGLFGSNNGTLNSAYATLLAGKQTGWGLGFEFSMPIGFRAAHSQVNNYEHRLAKARVVLAQQEQEVSYEIASVFQQIDQQFSAARTNFNRRRAAERRLQAFEAEYKVGRTTLDLLLRSQISLAQAEISYYQSLIGYNRALNDLRFRKGTALVENNVFLSEGLWTGEAYSDALRRAWERSFSFKNPYQETKPPEFAMEGMMQMPVSADTAIPEDEAPNGGLPAPSSEGVPSVPGDAVPPAPQPAVPDKRSAFQSDFGAISPAVSTPQSDEDGFIQPQLPRDDAEATDLPSAAVSIPSAEILPISVRSPYASGTRQADFSPTENTDSDMPLPPDVESGRVYSPADATQFAPARTSSMLTPTDAAPPRSSQIHQSSDPTVQFAPLAESKPVTLPSEREASDVSEPTSFQQPAVIEDFTEEAVFPGTTSASARSSRQPNPAASTMTRSQLLGRSPAAPSEASSEIEHASGEAVNGAGGVNRATYQSPAVPYDPAAERKASAWNRLLRK